jgi:hypothetical protein
MDFGPEKSKSGVTATLEATSVLLTAAEGGIATSVVFGFTDFR